MIETVDTELMEKVRDKYIKLGLSTEQYTQKFAENIISQVYSNLGLKMPEVLILASRKSLIDYLGKSPDITFSLYNYDAMAFYNYFSHFIPEVKEKTKNWDLLINLGEVVLYERQAICIQRPTKLWLNNAKQLHNNDTYAIEFCDGTGFCFWNGIPCEDRIIFNPETITKNEVLSCTNKELQRVLMAKFGIENLDLKVLDSNDWGTLVQSELRDVNGDIQKFIKVVNTTPEVTLNLSKQEINDVYRYLQKDKKYKHITNCYRHGDVVLIDKNKKTLSYQESTRLTNEFKKELEDTLKSILKQKKADDKIIYKDYYLQVHPTCKTVKEAFEKTLYKFRPDFIPVIQS
jgi:hypothetical protein